MKFLVWYSEWSSVWFVNTSRLQQSMASSARSVAAKAIWVVIVCQFWLRDLYDQQCLQRMARQTNWHNHHDYAHLGFDVSHGHCLSPKRVKHNSKPPTTSCQKWQLYEADKGPSVGRFFQDISEKSKSEICPKHCWSCKQRELDGPLWMNH